MSVPPPDASPSPEPAPYIATESVVSVGWFSRHAERIAAAVVFILGAAAAVLMMPPSRYPELAYVFAAPAVFWAYRAPSWRWFLGSVLGAQMVAWTITLGWLGNVTWAGLFLLGPFLGLWVGSWFVAVRWVMPRLTGRPWAHRILAVLGLAGAWVLLEWTRTWVLSGFPWLTLSATQWQRLSVLQPAAYTGAWGVSFVLIAVNVAFAAYGHKLLAKGEDRARTRCPEFIAAMVLLLGCLLLTATETFNRARFHRQWANVAFVQPAIPQSVKWDESQANNILKTLETETLKAAFGGPDLLLWPEATTPLAVQGDDFMRSWVEGLVRKAKAPMLLGSIGYEKEADRSLRWTNGVFQVTPAAGLAAESYAKRHLVPFGEYVPMRPVLGWLEKFVPVGGDFTPGNKPGLLTVTAGPAGQVTRIGSLICYEDIFPSLARESVRAGAEVLIVQTNNGWFGEGAAAYQHAAHAVLRAVETRRPVLRAGNAGWSGWIDECGAIRAVLTQVNPGGPVRTVPAERGENAGTIYFRGGATVQVTRDARYLGVETFYVQWGDWFVAVSAGLALATWLRLRRPYIAPVERESADRPFTL
ncbi:MAG: apolipoprotein N-acyltransferase [Verrucomicrobia bacterium]|nr:apolipoprotein N-acyltransferase [Verrucomicrobiota bacterium]